MFSHAGLSQMLASPPPAKVVDPGQNHFWLSGSLSFLKDPSGQMSFEAVQAAYMRGDFEPTHNFAVNSGYTGNKPIWVHFTLDYPAGDDSVWWLLMAPELLETITVYAEQPDGRYLTHEGGKSLPFDRREMEGVGHTFRLGRDPGGRRNYYIRITTKVAIKVEPSLWQERQLSRYLAGINAIYGVYAGVVVSLILASLMRVVRYRNPLDFAYFSYITGFEMFHLTNAGLVQAWRLTDSVIIRQGLIQTGIFLSGVCFVFLTRSLISWPNNPIRWLHHWPSWGLGLLLMSLAATAMIEPELFMEVNFNTAVALMGLSTLAGGVGFLEKLP